MEILRTGELQRLKYVQSHDLVAIRELCGIYGVGMPFSSPGVSE